MYVLREEEKNQHNSINIRTTTINVVKGKKWNQAAKQGLSEAIKEQEWKFSDR